MSQITAKLVSESEEQARQALAPLLELGDWQAAAKFCLSDGMVITNDTQQRITNFFLIIWFIEHYAEHKVGGI